MSLGHPYAAICVIFLAAFTTGLDITAYAVEKSPAAPGRGQVPKPGQKMGMDEPMATGMMKKGMRKGDVKSAADKKAEEMQPMMKQEEKAMPGRVGKPER